jgi:hypothetical protein
MIPCQDTRLRSARVGRSLRSRGGHTEVLLGIHRSTTRLLCPDRGRIPRRGMGILQGVLVLPWRHRIPRIRLVLLPSKGLPFLTVRPECRSRRRGLGTRSSCPLAQGEYKLGRYQEEVLVESFTAPFRAEGDGASRAGVIIKGLALGLATLTADQAQLLVPLDPTARILGEYHEVTEQNRI